MRVLAEAQADDLLALLRGRQVHEEHGVEAALAQQLGRQSGHVVGGGHEEHLGGGLLHPEEELPDEAARHRVVAGVGGEPLLDLVDPQDARGGPVGGRQRIAQTGLGLPDVHAHDRGHVEPVERQLPLLGDGLGGQGLAAPRHAAQEDALGRLDAPPGQVPRHEALLARQPLLEVLQPAHLVVVLEADPFEAGEVAEDPVLELGQLGEVLVADLLLGDEGRHDVDRLALRHPGQDLGGAADLGVLPLDEDVRPAVGADRRGDGLVELVDGGHVQGRGHAEPAQPGPHGPVRDEDDGAVVPLREPDELGEVTGRRGIALEVVEVGEDEVDVRPGAEGLLGLVEGGDEGVVVGDRRAGEDLAQPLGARVGEERHLPELGRELGDDLRGPHGLHGPDDDDRHPGFEESAHLIGRLAVVHHFLLLVMRLNSPGPLRSRGGGGSSVRVGGVPPTGPGAEARSASPMIAEPST